MAREIKFKVFHKRIGEIFDVMEINFQVQHIGVNINGYRKYIHFSDVEFLQYTGLKDKNGVKIYEGDVFKHSDKSNGIWSAKVEFINGQFGYDSTKCKCIENPKDWEKPYNKTGTGWFINSTNWTKEANFFPLIGGYTKISMDSIEVIGNIHQNPELI